MIEDSDGGGRFKEVVLQPEITLAAGADLARARALHHDAQEKCFIANSVNFTVRHEPVFQQA
jgi:organic hydroperoxide reductase OsmC/OhrA